MLKSFFRKYLIFGILILFVMSCFLPFVTGSVLEKQNHVSRDVIIVDDEGDGDYTSIKEAVNNANPGDTIEVYSGTYYEHGINIVDEGITLLGIPHELGNGSDRGKPFIDGEGQDYVIFFDAKNITLTSFHIENDGGSAAHDMIDLSQKAEGCTISNNDLFNTSFCLIYIKGSNSKIINNNISHSSLDEGICLRSPCHNCLVSGNIITDVETGLLLWESNNHTITGNKIMNCSDFGIDVAGSYNKIIGNHIEDNDIGIQIWNFFNSVKRNNFINNDLHAQFIYGIPLLQRFTNIWFGNYWDKPRLLPYPIPGVLVLLPIIQFDWRPALKPYNI